eukprot:498426_1
MALILLLSILLFCVTSDKYNDFKLCVQLSDGSAGKNAGAAQCTNWLSNGKSTSYWVGDSDWHDPEYIRVALKARKVSKSIKNVDFRFCIQVTDKSNHKKDGGEQQSDWQCTDWATKGADWSDWAYDDNKYDFDSVRVKIETKKVSGIYIKSVGAGVRGANSPKGTTNWQKGSKKYTSNMLGSSSESSSWTDWSSGGQKTDMDAVRIFLDAELGGSGGSGGSGGPGEICGEPVSTLAISGACEIDDSYSPSVVSPECPKGFDKKNGLCTKDKTCERDVGISTIEYDCPEVTSPNCPSGTTNLGAQCLEDCKDGYIDLKGACICDVTSYANDVVDYLDTLKSSSCFKTLQDKLSPIGKLKAVELDALFKSEKKDDILKTFEPYMGDIKTFFDSSRRRLLSSDEYKEGILDTVGAIEISASACGQAQCITSAAGIVLEFQTGELYFYYGTCFGFQSGTIPEVGVSVSLVLFDNIDAVSGQSRVFSLGVDLPVKAPVGVGFSLITNPKTRPI